MTRKEIIKEINRLKPNFESALENLSEQELNEILTIAQRNILIKDKIALIENRLKLIAGERKKKG